MFILTFTGPILHGTSLVHFMAMERKQSYLIDHGYLCENSNAENICLCRAFQKQVEVFSVPCSELSKLVTLHGMLFCFGVIATGFLFSVLFTSLVYVLQLQVSFGQIIIYIMHLCKTTIFYIKWSVLLMSPP